MDDIDMRPALLALLATAQAISAQPAWMLDSGTVQDQQGNAYFVGSVASDIVPVTKGAIQTRFNGGTCGTEEPFPGVFYPVPCQHGYAAKISADGKTVLYATYLEGRGNDYAYPVGVDASGNLFVHVNTTSTDFPQTGVMNGLPPISGTIPLNYILKLSADGSHLLFSRAFGFPGDQHLGVSSVNATVLTPDGTIVFAGDTDGTAFPTTPGAYLAARPNVTLDGFVFEWDPQKNEITHSTLIGGSNQDHLTALALDAQGNIYVTGYTVSTDFPRTPGAFYSPGAVVNSQIVNDFVCKFDPTLHTLDFSALFGGAYHPIPSSIAVDSAGDVYVDAWGSVGMPVTPGAFETSWSGGSLVKLAGTNGSRIYFTYLGDGGGGFPGAITSASDGSVWVAGSNQWGGMVTTPNALMPTLANIFTEPAYLKHISADGSQQLYGTYLLYDGLSGLLALVAPGVVLTPSPTAFFETQNFNTPSPPLQGPLITSVVNAASFSQPDFVAPGEIVSITGLSIGPTEPVSYSVVNGVVSSNLNGLQVLIQGLPAPILYASANQINVIAPWGIPITGDVAQSPIPLEVQNPALSAALTTGVNSVPSLPGIFEVEGAGLILNQDSKLNGPTNPAKQGSIISLFVTGLGLFPVSPQDGSFATVTTSPALPVQVFLGFSGSADSYVALDPSAIKYAGDAPGEIEGLEQINVQLPAGAVFNSLYITAGSVVSNAVKFFEQ